MQLKKVACWLKLGGEAIPKAHGAKAGRGEAVLLTNRASHIRPWIRISLIRLGANATSMESLTRRPRRPAPVGTVRPLKRSRFMEKAKEYRACAETAVDLATRSDNETCKIILLKIAQGWLDLAQRAEIADKKVKMGGPSKRTGRSSAATPGGEAGSH